MSVYEDLKSIISDPERLVAPPAIAEEFLSDTLGRRKGWADALVFALSTEEVSQVMKYAWDNNVPVTPRGAGTNLVGSTVPDKGGIVLDLSKMDRILEVDRDNFIVTVEAGKRLNEFQTYLEGIGLFYPPDPGEKTASLGGNIATNAGGMRAVKYGVTRDYVRGLEVVLADGTVLELGTKNVKDASGLSLKSLVIGSEGTLAVITKAMLKVIVKPETTSTILIPFSDLSSGIGSVLKLLHADANPTAVEFVDRAAIAYCENYTGLKYPYPEAGSYIIVTLDGRESEVRARTEIIREVAVSNGAYAFLPLSPDQAADIWKVRGAIVKAVEAVSEQEPVDIVVPIAASAQFIAFIRGLEKSSGVEMVAFGHAGDGNVHLCVLRGGRSEEEWQRDLESAMDKAYAEAYRLGGLASAEHGIGLSKRRYFLHETAKGNIKLMNAIKDAVDPRHILNDGKSYIVKESGK